MRLFFLFEFRQYSSLPGLLIFYGAMLVGLFSLTLSGDYVDYWSAVDAEAFSLMLLAGVPLAFLLGLVCYGWEELQGNREFILHRSRSRIWVLWVRTFGTALVAGPLLAVAFAPPLLARFLGLDGGGVQLDVWRHYLGLSAVLLTGLFAGAFVACVRGGSSARTVVGVVVAGGVIAQGAWLAGAPPGELVRSMESYVLLQLALSLAFVPGIVGGFLTGNDPDRPTPVLQKLCIAIPTGALAAVAAALLTSELQDDLHREYMADLPAVYVSDAEGEATSLALGRTSSSAQRVYSPWEDWADQRQHAAQRSFGRMGSASDCAIGTTWTRLTWASRRGDAYLIQPQGVVGCIVESRDRGRPEKQVWRLAKGSSPGRFSELAHRIGDRRGVGRRSDLLVLGDPADGTLWALAPADPAASIVELPLPGGDRYRGWEEFDLPDEAERPGDEKPQAETAIELASAFLASATPAPADESRELDYGLKGCLVHGERGSYRWRAGAWTQAEERPDEAFAGTVESRFAGPLDLRAEVRSESGELLFEHSYAPRSALEQRRTAGLFGLSLLRSPLVHVASYVRSAPTPEPGASASRVGGDWAHFRRAVLREPLLLGGKRPWLLGVVLVNAFLLAAWGAVRLTRMDAGRGRAAAWFALLLAGGLPAGIVYLLLEPRRAYAPLPEPDAESAGASEPLGRPIIETPRFGAAGA